MKGIIRLTAPGSHPSSRATSATGWPGHAIRTGAQIARHSRGSTTTSCSATRPGCSEH